MPLTPGSTLGPYEVVAAIGAGGMGTVFHARDTRLGRDVAIKVLPEAFAGDPDRVARFTREAQTLAALNHPNIAQIHGLEQSGDIHALVMELVEGHDLSAHIARGPMTAADAVPIARQIADALEAAHEQGIIHRDLKPANVKVRSDGTVKVLDFGLAKVLSPDVSAASADAMNSPTLTARATQLGMILGTAAYMAPEQAKGKPVDKRADIWAFGVVLYEMLTGRRAFDGDDISTTLAAVLMRDPEWTALPADTPPALRTLIQRCLERDPKQRLRDIGEARVLLAGPAVTTSRVLPATVVAPSRSSRAAWVVAAISLAAAAGFAALWFTTRSGAAGASEFFEASLTPPAGHSFGSGFALSPDGRRLVTAVWNVDTGVASLWIRELNGGTPAEVPHTEGATIPFWAPDGSAIGFFADGKLKIVDLNGSPPQLICDAPSPRGGAWGSDGTIVFSGYFRRGLERVPAAGGTPKPLTTLDESRKEKSHRWPVFLPDGEHILFLAQTGEAGAKDDDSAIEALNLSTGARTRLVTANSSPLYSAAGFLLFWREGALRAQRFDTNRLAISGAVFAVASGVAFDTNELAHASVAANNTLVYSTSADASRSDLIVADRSGRPIRTIAESVRVETGMTLSHDAQRLAVGVTAEGARDINIWIYDLVRGTAGPLTFDEASDVAPVWSSDDTQVIYTNQRVNDGIIFRRFADGRGQAEQVIANPSGAGVWPSAWSRDGTWMVIESVADETSRDLLRYDLAAKTFEPLVQSPFDDFYAALSADERWLAYASTESGREEVYVRSMSGDGRWRISSAGGTLPAWRRDGRELYFVTPQNQIMAVAVEPGPVFRPAAPRQLFRAEFHWGAFPAPFAAFPDGQQFVIDVVEDIGQRLLTLVTDWTKARKP